MADKGDEVSTRKGTTKNKGKKHELDKFYTAPEIAQWCVNKLTLSDYELIIEPSAGNGVFSSYLNQVHKNVLAFDIHPEAEHIVRQDWFDYQPEENARILVIGNPPFGQQNTLAIRFINHATKFADTIAFILPKSFMKDSVQNKLEKYLHLEQQFILPKNSFILEDKPVDVPAVYQIWKKKNYERRIIPLNVLLTGVTFVKKSQQPDVYIQRIGGNAGRAGLDWQQRSEQSNYFIKIQNKAEIAEFIKKVNSLNFPSRDYTVGPRSISKVELIRTLTASYPQYGTITPIES